MSNRQGIARFSGKSELSDVEFLQVFKRLLPNILSGNLIDPQNKNVDIVEKMDSSFINFGINNFGQFFIQTSNSPEITQQNYKTFLKSKVLYDFLASFESLLKNTLFQSKLQEIYKTYGPFKVDAELFPVLTHRGDGEGNVIFNATKYSKQKLGSEGALVLFKAWITDENKLWTRPSHKDAQYIISAIQSASSNSWKIYNNESLKIEKDIDTSPILSILPSYLTTEHGIEKAIRILQQKTPNNEKKKIKSDIQNIKIELQKVLDDLSNSQSSILANEGDFSPVEGVVLRIKNEDGTTTEIKGTSETFIQEKEKRWKIRTEISNLERELQNDVLQQLLGLSISEKDFSKILSSLSDSFSTSAPHFSNEKEFFSFIFNKLGVPIHRINTQDIFDVIDKYISKIDRINDAFESEKNQLDADTIRKTQDVINDLKHRLTDLKNTLHGEPTSFDVLIKAIKVIFSRTLEKKVGRFMNTEESSITFDQYYQGLTPVILWIGRAQPWHIGHHQMIEEARKYFPATGAEKILIVLVKGKESSADTSKNPLTEKEQNELISSVYKDTDDVVVSDFVVNTANPMTIINVLTKNQCYLVGLLAGEDRMKEYQKMFVKFNARLWIKDHDFLPIKVKNDGSADITFILTPRVMSGTEARESALSLTFTDWLKKIAPPHISLETKRIYKNIYDKIRALKEQYLLEKKIYKMFFPVSFSNILNEKNTLNSQDLNTEEIYNISSSDDTENMSDEELAKYFQDNDHNDQDSQESEKNQNNTNNQNNKENQSNKENQNNKENQDDQTDQDDVPFEEFNETIQKQLPSYAAVVDPELTNKILKNTFSFLGGAVLWMLKAQNQKGGEHIESLFSSISNGYKNLINQIKNNKLQAQEANNLLIKLRTQFSKKIQEYKKMREEIIKSLKINQTELDNKIKNARLEYYTNRPKEKITSEELKNKLDDKKFMIAIIKAIQESNVIQQKYPHFIDALNVIEKEINKNKVKTGDEARKIIYSILKENNISERAFLICFENVKNNNNKLIVNNEFVKQLDMLLNNNKTNKKLQGQNKSN